MKRSTFIKNTGLIAAGIAFTKHMKASVQENANKLPKWKGFNLLDFFSPKPAADKLFTQEEHFKWMQDWGLEWLHRLLSEPRRLWRRYLVTNSLFVLKVMSELLAAHPGQA